ncbi:PilZ domain-containing protein [Simiduia agarivorans]|uniref:Type IV pilus assembly protein PilZ n=1 Tax=Simiduia agarivorans (strain DSM 21679 / JCM 13881 / BCRC 17597 / SA1) TaxID=1117647 RepID=K4KNS8_SIMAS|nr:PilZ domain-containing protein [Simiduia agarivorans]AFV00830.1 type IV pilus assembly protein PilZ [Simiduia agarivorans SA1 = DSM 21679]
MSLANRAYSEKRNFIRMRIDSPVEIHTSDDAELQGFCSDLSGGGMAVEIDKALPVGTQLTISLSSSHGHSPMLRAKAHVARVHAGPNETCTLGLEIDELIG